MSLRTRTESSGVLTVRQDNELGRTTLFLSVDEQRALLTALTDAEAERQERAARTTQEEK